MAAHAALVSLMHTINSFKYLPQSRFAISLDKNPIKALAENVTILREFLEDYSHLAKEGDCFNTRIADAAYAAQDVIGSQLVDQIALISTSHGEKKLYQSLLNVVDDIDLITKEAMEIKVKIATVKQVESIHDLEISEENILPRTVLRCITPSEEVFGREQDRKTIVSKLIDSDGIGVLLSVTPIVGRSGIGKTTLARVVYEEGSVREHFELRVWVKVGNGEFNQKHAAHQILEYLIGMQCSLDDLDELDEMVRDTLQSHRCLIVFDGIESMSKGSWVHMNQCWFDFLDLGSKIVITTPSKDVADLVAEKSFELKQLSSNDSWSLFQSVVLNTYGVNAENLATACEGVPLLLKLFGGLLRYSDKIRDQLLCSNLFPAATIISFCIWELPPHLRQCLAYCTLFPKGYAFSKVMIVDLWIADGLVRPSLDDHNLLDVGDDYFHQLLSRSFFTDITCDQFHDIIGFRIPTLIHKVIEDVSGTFYEGKLGFIGSVGEDAAQLSLVSPGEYDSDHMRTVITSPTLYLGGSLDHFSLLDFPELHSLDLSCSGIKNLSDDIRVCTKIRYLNLSYTLIERLPDSITDLCSLQTLDLSWCYHLKVLPKGLGGLKLMSHLDLSRCESLSSLPSGIDSLLHLGSMPLFVLGKEQGCARLGELSRLNHLQGKLEIRNLENVKEVTEADDPKLYKKRLQHLELHWNQAGYQISDFFRVLDLLRPNQLLKALDIIGYNGFTFPKWISSMNSLIKISIIDCGCDELPSLGQLPLLKELLLKTLPRLRWIGPRFYGGSTAEVVFHSLEQLQLYDLPRLVQWSGPSTINAFLNLKSLTIEGCSQLRNLPSFPTLPDLIASSCDISHSFPRFQSLRSLVINDVEFQWRNHGAFHSIKKLILQNVPSFFLEFIWGSEGNMWTQLEHLCILNCNNLIDVCLKDFCLLKKLHIVNCQNLGGIQMLKMEVDRLMELVLDDCPQLDDIYFPRLHCLRKLMVRNCSKLAIDLDNLVRIEKLQYLSISGCPTLESHLNKHSELISDVPCIIVENHKAKY